VTRPLVSIVTPSLNQGAFIEAALRSVADQEYVPIEHIVMDGGSTDQTLDVLKSFEGSYDLRWFSEPDDGMYDAINKGLEMARGEFVAYLNTDDRYPPWAVATAVAALLENPNAPFVYGDALRVDAEGIIALELFPSFSLRYIRRSGFLCQPTVFLRRSALDEGGGFDTSLKFIGDCELWMRIGNSAVRKVDEVLAVEHTHPATKRETVWEALSEELRGVRTRHGYPHTARSFVGALYDRAWAYAARRAALIRFMRSALGAGNGWQGLRNATPRVEVSLPFALVTLLPVAGGKTVKRILRFPQGAPWRPPSP
jgi:glycosyltransferase involved in cell wall biosynthesis